MKHVLCFLQTFFFDPKFKQYQADKVELTLKEEKDLIGGFVLKVGFSNALKSSSFS